MNLLTICSNTQHNHSHPLDKAEKKFTNKKFKQAHLKINKHYKLVTTTLTEFEKNRFDRLKKSVSSFNEDLKEIDDFSRDMIQKLRDDSKKIEAGDETPEDNQSNENTTTDDIQNLHDQFFE
jgi:tellurite resistance protein